jgi:hypothetical protein
MSLKIDDLRDLLAQKFSREKKRLKSYGTKTDSFQMANVVVRYVQALMCDSRNRELKRLKKLLRQGDLNKIWKHVRERLKATSRMAKAIRHVAEETEKKRPWKKTVEHKHKHRSKH